MPEMPYFFFLSPKLNCRLYTSTRFSFVGLAIESAAVPWDIFPIPLLSVTKALKSVNGNTCNRLQDNNNNDSSRTGCVASCVCRRWDLKITYDHDNVMDEGNAISYTPFRVMYVFKKRTLARKLRVIARALRWIANTRNFRTSQKCSSSNSVITCYYQNTKGGSFLRREDIFKGNHTRLTNGCLCST